MSINSGNFRVNATYFAVAFNLFLVSSICFFYSVPAIAADFPGLSQASSPAPPAFDVFDLGTLGGTQSSPAQINNLGAVVGSAFIKELNSSGGGLNHAFVWTPDQPNGSTGTMKDIGTVNGDPESDGMAINSNGDACGQSDNFDSTPQDFRAFLYRDGSMIDLGDNGGVSALADGINSKGDLCGTYFDSSFINNAYFSPNGSGFSRLSTLGGDNAFALGLNDADDVVGSSEVVTNNNNTHACLWPAAGSPVDLGTLGGPESQAMAINSNGVIVGWAETATLINGFNEIDAFEWTPTTPGGSTGTMADLNVFPGNVQSEAIGVNNLGDVVGWYDGGSRPFLYVHDTNTVYDLNNLLNTSGFRIEQAESINDSGEIVAFGTSDGTNFHALLLVPASTFAVTVAPSRVGGGLTAVATVLFSPAPITNVTFKVTSSDPAGAPVPTTIVFPAGKTHFSFKIKTKSVTKDAKVLISLTDTTNFASTTFMLIPLIEKLTVNNGKTVSWGDAVTSVATLGVPAPGAGLTVAFAATINKLAFHPAKGTVSGGGTTVSSSAVLPDDLTDQIDTFSASSGSSSKSIMVTIKPALDGLTLSAAKILGGQPVTGTLSFFSQQTAGSKVALTSSNEKSAGVASNAVVSSTGSASFTVKTAKVKAPTTVMISATYRGFKLSQNLLLQPPPPKIGVVLSPKTIVGGLSEKIVVTYVPAPTANQSVTIQSSDTTNAAVPGAVTILAGKSSAAFSTKVKPVLTSETVTITASQGTVKGSAPFELVPLITSVTINSGKAVSWGDSVPVLATLGIPAPASGLSVTFSASVKGFQFSPATVKVAAGKSAAASAAVSPDETTTKTVTLTASCSGVSKSVPVAIKPALFRLKLSANTVVGGQKVTDTLEFNTQQKAGSVVTVASSKPNTASVPKTAPVTSTGADTFPVTSAKVKSATGLTISATYRGVTVKAGLTVEP